MDSIELARRFRAVSLAQEAADGLHVRWLVEGIHVKRGARGIERGTEIPGASRATPSAGRLPDREMGIFLDDLQPDDADQLAEQLVAALK